MGLVITAQPDHEPVDLCELKNHLRVEEDDDNALIRSLGVAARKYVEDFTGRQIVTATYRLTLDQFPAAIVLPRPPAASITSITYIDTDGASQTLDASGYQLDAASEPARVVPAVDGEWPDTQGGKVNAVTVTYVAGYGDATASPDGLKLVIKTLVGHWYEERSATVSGTIIAKVPLSVEALLWQYRVGDLMR